MAVTADIVRDVVKVAKKNGIEPAALMAVVEIESAGQPFEQDGKTPRFLYERHVMYRELKKLRGLARAEAAVNAGLARIGWNKATQYSDQRNSASRLALMTKAKAFDAECACRSASWGLGQTMGFHAESQGFKNAVEFVACMTDGGVAAQIEAMVKEIKKSGLIDEINRHDWAGFAFRYNGAGYKQNQYDTRMAQAYAGWKNKLPKINLEVPKPTPPKVPPPPDIEESETPPVKPGWFRSWSARIKAILTAIGFGGLTWLTDWQIAAAFFAFILILIGIAITVFFWIFDAEDVRVWIRKQFA